MTFDEYGYVVAADAFASMIFSPIFGYFCDRMGQIRGVSLLCGVLFTGGNAMYALLSLIPRGDNKIRVWMMLVARLIVGAGTSKLSYEVIHVYEVTLQPYSRHQCCCQGLHLQGDDVSGEDNPCRPVVALPELGLHSWPGAAVRPVAPGPQNNRCGV